jgi:hypothetical protein
MAASSFYCASESGIEQTPDARHAYLPASLNICGQKLEEPGPRLGAPRDWRGFLFGTS